MTFDAKFDFYMLPTRAFELLLGSSLAFVEHDGKRFFAPWCYLFGLAVVFFCIFGFGRVPKVLDRGAELAQVAQQQGHATAALGELEGRVDAARNRLHVVYK